MEILDIIIGFLAGSATAGVLMVYFYNKLGKIVEQTETEIDDTIHENFPQVVDFIVENFDIGVAEDILKNFLQQLNKTPEDTRIAEKKVEEELNKVKK